MADPLPLLIPHPTLTHGRTQYALANGEVNYMGEAIAFVVADDRYVAEDAVGRIRVDYEFLPPVVGIDAARAAAHLVHEDVPGNVGARMEQHNGDAAAAIAGRLAGTAGCRLVHDRCRHAVPDHGFPLVSDPGRRRIAHPCRTLLTHEAPPCPITSWPLPTIQFRWPSPAPSSSGCLGSSRSRPRR